MPIQLDQLVVRLATSRGRLCYYERGKIAWKSFFSLAVDVERLKTALTARGIQPGSRIGVIPSQSCEWIVCNLALLELRCLAVFFGAVHSTHSAEELASKYSLQFLIDTRVDLQTLIAGESVQQFPLGNMPESHAADAIAEAFSSGTTGEEKRMLTSRRGLEDLVDRFFAAFPPLQDDRFLIFLPLHNIQQHSILYGALWHDLDLAIVEWFRVFTAFREFKPTLLVGPPMLYELLETQAKQSGAALREAFGGQIRLMLTGMAPIKRSSLDFYARSNMPLFEAYGLAETGVLTWNTPQQNRLGSVGVPIENGSITLADDGEILVQKRSPLTLGYAASTGSDRKVYLPDGRIATGDIGRFDADGFLYIVGRKSDIISTSGGEKIHPRQLEQQLEQTPGVVRAVVVKSPHGPSLIALVSLAADSSDEVADQVCREVARTNAASPAATQVGSLVFTRAALSVENGMLTQNLKVRRQAVYDFVGEFPPAADELWKSIDGVKKLWRELPSGESARHGKRG